MSYRVLVIRDDVIEDITEKVAFVTRLRMTQKASVFAAPASRSRNISWIDSPRDVRIAEHIDEGVGLTGVRMNHAKGRRRSSSSSRSPALIIDKLFGMDAPSSIIFAPIVGRFIFMAYLSATKGTRCFKNCMTPTFAKSRPVWRFATTLGTDTGGRSQWRKYIATGQDLMDAMEAGRNTPHSRRRRERHRQDHEGGSHRYRLRSTQDQPETSAVSRRQTGLRGIRPSNEKIHKEEEMVYILPHDRLDRRRLGNRKCGCDWMVSMNLFTLQTSTHSRAKTRHMRLQERSANQLANEIEKMAKTFNRDFRQDPREDKSNTCASSCPGTSALTPVTTPTIATSRYTTTAIRPTSLTKSARRVARQSRGVHRYAIGGHEMLEEAEAAVQEECAEGFANTRHLRTAALSSSIASVNMFPMDRYGRT